MDESLTETEQINCDALQVHAVGQGLLNFAQLGDLKNVLDINVHCNRLSSLQGLPQLKFLRSLNLSSNEFGTCDLPELSFMPCLATLDLAGNAIESLEEVPFLPGLEELSIAFNNVSNLNGLENIPNLVCLDIRANYIAHQRDMMCLQDHSKLQELKLADEDGRNGNPVSCNVLAILGLFDTCSSLLKIDGKAKEQWPHLEDLNLTPKFDELAKRARKKIESEKETMRNMNKKIDRDKQEETVVHDNNTKRAETIMHSPSPPTPSPPPRRSHIPVMTTAERPKDFTNPWIEAPVVSSSMNNLGLSSSDEAVIHRHTNAYVNENQVCMEGQQETNAESINEMILRDKISAEKHGFAIGILAGLDKKWRRNQMLHAFMRLACSEIYPISSSSSSMISCVGIIKSRDNEIIYLKNCISNMEADHATIMVSSNLQDKRNKAFKDQQISALKRQLVLQEAAFSRRTQLMIKSSNEKVDMAQRITSELMVNHTTQKNTLNSQLIILQNDMNRLNNEMTIALERNKIAEERIEMTQTEIYELQTKLKTTIEENKNKIHEIELKWQERLISSNNDVELSKTKLIQSDKNLNKTQQILQSCREELHKVRNASTVALEEAREASRRVLEQSNEKTIQIDELIKSKQEQQIVLEEQKIARQRAESRLKRMQQVVEETTSTFSQRIEEQSRKITTQRHSMSKLCDVTRAMKKALRQLHDKCGNLERRAKNAEDRAVRAEATEKEIVRVRSQVGAIEKMLVNEGLNRRQGWKEGVMNEGAEDEEDSSKTTSINVVDKRGVDVSSNTSATPTTTSKMDDGETTATSVDLRELMEVEYGALVSRNKELELALRVKTTMLDDQNRALEQLRADLANREADVSNAVQHAEEVEYELQDTKTMIEELEEQLGSSYDVEKKLRKLVTELTDGKYD